MGTPSTVAEVLDVVLGTPGRGNARRPFDMATPSRYAHLADLLKEGVPPALVVAAEQRINASGWVKKPAREVTDADLAQLAVDRPWEAA